MDTLTAVVTFLADEPRNTGPDFGKASPFGLLITVALLVGTFALVWSMNRHLRRLPESFDPEHPEPDQAVDDGTVETTEDEQSDDTSEERSDDRQPRESGG
ncbi:hypothetical protein [Mycolicibacterium brisbanense]|uniref:Uncharacterized protein n=1 Tax=Mycolicibacterium brisbanense TaxID=146020 RepID=A0A100W2H8_9MYCO|nr:hypothetical protein [Mycolicibacterium brisbanense]MCV7158519.1 hypothetical protein [Mycolicibacterium brisbanense]GAS90429.1 hypothetical protein RMCB_4525 [Mycolicibacterium brisbanense]